MSNKGLCFAVALLALLLGFCTKVRGQVLPEQAAREPVLVIAAVEVRRGEGCMAATKRTKFPLGRKDCDELSGRYAWIDRSNIMKPTIRPLVLQPGDRLLYAFTAEGNGWVPSSP